MRNVKKGMTSRERVFAALQHREFDAYPAINPTSVATIESMNAVNSFFPEAHTEADAIARLAAYSYTNLGFDTIMPYFSVHLEADMLGCDVDWGTPTRFPIISSHSIKSIDNLSIPKNILSKRLCKQYLNALKNLKKQYGEEAVIVGKVLGPWSLIYNMYGVENLFIDIVIDPGKIHDVLKELVEIPIEFALAQFEAGADMLTWAEHVTSDIISAKIYEDFMLEIHKYARRKLPSDKKIIMHTCGNVIDRIQIFSRTGFDVFHIDSRNDIKLASSLLSNKMLLVGGINNPNTLSGSDISQIKKEVSDSIEKGITLPAPECAITVNVPNANLVALTECIHSYPVRR